MLLRQAAIHRILLSWRTQDVQQDKRRYAEGMLQVLRRQPSLELVEAEVAAVELDRGRVSGARLTDGARVSARW